MSLPPSSQQAVELLMLHYSNRDFHYAEVAFRDLTSFYPDCAELWFMGGMIAKQKGDLKLAEEYLEQAFKLKKNPVPPGFIE